MKRLFFLISSFGCVMVGNAQSVGPSTINATGGSRAVAGNTYEWSIGETITSTYSGPSLVVTQGVLQPRLNTTGVVTTSTKFKELRVYPNPVSDGMLYLQPAFKTGGKITCQLTDAAGKTVIVQSDELKTGNELQSIPMNALAAGQYTLAITWSDKEGQSNSNYKIQKIR